MLRRPFNLILVASLLFGCQMTEPVVSADSSTFSVTSVKVALADPVSIDKRLARWDIGVTSERFVEDVRLATSQALRSPPEGGGRPVAVKLTLIDLTLDSTIPGLLQSPLITPYPYSRIVAEVQVHDAQSGELLIRRNFLGDDNPGEHTFGSTVRSSFSGGKSLPEAYQDVVNGFAEDLVRQFKVGFDKTT